RMRIVKRASRGARVKRLRGFVSPRNTDARRQGLCLRVSRFRELASVSSNRGPGLVRVEPLNLLCSLNSIRTEVLLINHSVVAHHECHHSGVPILRRKGYQSEAADHGSVHEVIHLSERGVRPLPFQYFEVVPMPRLSARVTAFDCARDIFTDGATPSTVGV